MKDLISQKVEIFTIILVVKMRQIKKSHNIPGLGLQKGTKHIQIWLKPYLFKSSIQWLCNKLIFAITRLPQQEQYWFEVAQSVFVVTK